MGVFNKLKSIFYDEITVDDEEETEEISKVNKIVKPKERVVEEKPKIEEIKFEREELEPLEEVEEKVKESPKLDNTYNERELFRSERTFNFVDFDDDEEEKVDEPPVQRRNVLSEENRISRAESTPAKDVTKVFKPTPVISPIWGVLDKDYKKEEITEKTPSTEEQLKSAVTSYDTVRRKAYGTLEDELEDTLNSMSKITTDKINEEINKVDKDVDLLEQKTSKIEDLISKIEEETDNIDGELTVGDLEDNIPVKGFDDEEEEEPKKVETKPAEVSDETLTDSTLEHDLFNLIDSMYDKEE